LADLGAQGQEPTLTDEPVGPPCTPVAPVVTAAGSSPGELDKILRLTLALFAIGFAVWLLLAASAYRRQYSGTGAAWHRGAHNFIEITLVREDRANLACAAGPTMQGLHCGFGADQRPWGSTPPTSPSAQKDDGGHDDDRQILRPYNTVNGELFLGAGLWDALAPRGSLPAGRFTVTCDLEIVGAVRSVALRWTVGGSFDRSAKTLAVGALHDCAIPP
jgi:hypothetical protein